MNNSKYLTFEEVKGLCKSLNIKISKEKLQDAFDQANTKKDRSLKEKGQDVLNEDEFVDFYYHLMRRPEIDELFDKYAKEDEVRRFSRRQRQSFYYFLSNLEQGTIVHHILQELHESGTEAEPDFR